MPTDQRPPLTLRTVAPFLPGTSTSVEDLREPLGLTHSEVTLLTRVLGLDRISKAGGLTVLDMMLRAAETALSDVDPSEVRYLIHAHTMPHVAPPGSGLTEALRAKLGLGEARAFAMSHQSCVTGLHALTVAEALLRAEPAGAKTLILTGDKVSSPAIQMLPGVTFLGDAAAAIVVELGGSGDAVLALAHRTLGEYYLAGDMSPELHRRYQQIYVPTLASVITEAVGLAGLAMDDVALVLPHNVNRFSWSVTARLAGLPLDRIYLDNVPKLGHCFCADPFVNFACARAGGALRPGELVLLVSAGQGGTFGATVVRIGGGHE